MTDVTEDTTDSGDDLDIAEAVKKNLKRDDGQVAPRYSSSEKILEDYKFIDGKLVWSDDDDDFPPQSRSDKKPRRRQTTTTKRKRDASSKDSFVGKRARSKSGREGRQARRQRVWGESSDDDQLMEYTLPEYLQKRRANFEARTERFKEMGLKLPPSYDDIDFSDDERLADLAEKPEFERSRPGASYKDKTLPKSLGLIPAPIAQWLRDYQVEGTAFLHTLFVYQSGGILGDDMGKSAESLVQTCNL